MSLITKEVCVCDQCGREREKDKNHWWLVWASDQHFHVQTWNDRSAKDGIGFGLHLCGLTCLYQAIDKLAQKILKAESVVK